jgi:heme exporter protein D|tara:strand:+ start:228 stop:392 length:165 start_codon:yes stop_codon:yes gene_type:complete
MIEFLEMGGYAAYVWSCYGIVALVLLLNSISSWRRYQNLLLRLKRLHSEKKDDT